MKNYAKIQDDGSISHMPAPRHISNPSAATLTEWAAAQGYKELRTTVAPSPYHTRSYREYTDFIGYVWSKPSLDELKARKKQAAERIKEQALQSSAVLAVEGVGGVLYDTEAQINIVGLLVMGAGVTAPIDFTLADDSVVALDNAQLKSIALACEAHKTGIHNIKRAAFTAIDAAETVEELLKINK